jgi:hypothetical protein
MPATAIFLAGLVAACALEQDSAQPLFRVTATSYRDVGIPRATGPGKKKRSALGTDATSARAGFFVIALRAPLSARRRAPRVQRAAKKLQPPAARPPPSLPGADICSPV